VSVRVLAGEVTFDGIFGETKDYALVVSLNPEPEFVCYAIRNKTTFVDEYLSSNLAKARHVLQEVQKDLDEGYDRHTRADTAQFVPGATKLKGGPIGGALNG
jgi:hypothetical protein